MNKPSVPPSAAIRFKIKPATQFVDERKHPKELKNAILIYNQALDAVENFHNLYVTSQKPNRPSTQGEHDILRAMLLFACSGLDAVVKQLVQDGLKLVLSHDEGAQREFRKFAERRLKKASAGDSPDRTAVPGTDVGFLADLMVSFDPRTLLIANLTEALVADSLQSRDQLLRVAAHFAITRDDVMANDKITKDAFDARNQITHEMDVDLRSGKARRERHYETMVEWSENIADIARCFIIKTGEKIAKGNSSEARPLGS